MVLVGEGDRMVMVLVGHADRMAPRRKLPSRGVAILSAMTFWHMCAGFAGGTAFFVWVRLGKEFQCCSRFGTWGG